jgi:hypothetical protein
MSTRLIILSGDRNFMEWGAGCALRIMGPMAQDGGWHLQIRHSASTLHLGEFASEKQAREVRELWLQRIIGAEDGGLLRWDDERECVVDELGDDDDVFADSFSVDPPDCAECGEPMKWEFSEYEGGRMTNPGYWYCPKVCEAMGSGEREDDTYNGQPSPGSHVPFPRPLFADTQTGPIEEMVLEDRGAL